jgi:hypothetical protein
MSLATLKKKSNATHNISGRSTSLHQANNRLSPGKTTSNGHIYSINGKRTNNRVGTSMEMSKGLSKMKPGTNEWKGYGGYHGQYNKNAASGKYGTTGENDPIIKLSVLSTKGMLEYKSIVCPLIVAPPIIITQSQHLMNIKSGLDINNTTTTVGTCDNWIDDTLQTTTYNHYNHILQLNTITCD